MQVKIFEPNRIPRNAKFYVAAAGLLGDRFVDVIPETEDVGGFFQAGEVVHGSTKPGVEELTDQAGKLIVDLRAAVANLNGTITRINTDLLKPEMFQNLQTSVANLNATTKNFQTASEKVNGVLDDAKGAVAGVNKAIDGAKDTLSTADKAADDSAQGHRRIYIRRLPRPTTAIDEAVHGKGLLGTLISDHALSDDLAALVSNLRRSGVLFYRNRPETNAPPAPSPTPSRRSSQR